MSLQLFFLTYLVTITHTKDIYYAISSQMHHDFSCIRGNKTFHPCGILESYNSDYFHQSDRHKIIYMLDSRYTVSRRTQWIFNDQIAITIKPWRNNSQVLINCAQYLSISCHNIQRLVIESISFQHCEGDLSPSLLYTFGNYTTIQLARLANVTFNKMKGKVLQIMSSIHDLHVVNSVFTEIEGYAVYVSSNQITNATISNCTFNNNVNGSIWFHIKSRDNASSLRITNCLFSNNTSLNFFAERVIYLKCLQSVTIENSYFIKNSKQGAILIQDGYTIANQRAIVRIENSTFVNNSAHSGGAIRIIGYIDIIIVASEFIINKAIDCGGAIKLIVIRNGLVIITNSLFNNNSAFYGGAVEILASHSHVVSVTNSTFLYNRAKMDGGGFSMNEFVSHFQNCIFLKNVAVHSNGGSISIVGTGGSTNLINCKFGGNSASNGSGGSVYINFVQNLTLLACSFSYNRAKNGGAINVTSLYVVLKRSNFIGNEVSNDGGAFTVASLYFFVIKGLICLGNSATNGNGGCLCIKKGEVIIKSSRFENNTAKHGGAMYFSNNKVVVKNIQVFNNHAHLNGGGIATVSSTINLDEYVGFINNTINYTTGIGGAIYINDQPEDCGLNSCPFSWTNTSMLEFIENFAVTGSILYGGMIDRCSTVTNNSLDNALATLTKTNKDINITSAITSRAIQFCYCFNSNVNCDTKEVKRSVSLGQSFEVAVSCVDQIQQPISCVVKSAYNMTDFELDQCESARLIHTCENLTFHIYSKETVSVELEMKSDIYCTDTMWNTLKVFVTVENCPLGFQANENKCNCDERLQNSFKDINCNISNKSIKMNDLGWFSYENGLLRIHNNCPLNYCSQVKYYFSPVNPDVQCKDNHGGILCGGCLNNYSIVLGSSKCMLCSHTSSRYNFIWLTIIMVIAGVALVVFLLLLKMTVSSGTINSLIFYANIVSFSGVLDTCPVNSVLQIFLSWINLDLGIEVCFYSGMDVYQKTWLQFVFPFYIWLLVGIIIVLCHYSTTIMKLMGMRNIEVLATLFLLSYAKLLKTIVTSLSFTDIMVAEADNFTDPLVPSRVWLFDGELSYLSGRHLPLFIVAILFLLLLFLPYTLLLTIGHYLQSLPNHRSTKFFHSSIFTSIMDAYHAPFTKKHRYWIGLGLLVRCSLFTIFATSYNIHTNIFWSIISIVILFSARLCIGVKVYQKKLVDLLEVFFLLNLLILMFTLYREFSCEAITVSISLSSIVFGLIVLYHVYFELTKYEFFYTILKSNIYSLQKNCLPTLPRIAEEEEVQEPSTSYVELREPLIGL